MLFKIKSFLMVIALMSVLVGCGGGSSSGTAPKDDSSGSGDEPSGLDPVEVSSVKFLSFYLSSSDPDERSIEFLDVSSGASLSSELLQTSSEGTPSSQTVDSTIYPPQVYGGGYDFISNVAAYGNTYAMSLHKDFNLDNGYMSRGVVGDLDTKTFEYLPLVDPERSSHGKYFGSGSANVSPSGHVFYISYTDHRVYGDDSKEYYMRYDTKSKESEIADPCKSFILAQPEKGVDTETCNMNGFSSSEDGRYIYGDMQGYGVDGGVLHWDYRILYQYDYTTKTYARLGDEGERDVLFLGTTSDGKYIVYLSDGQTKVQNIDTRTIRIMNNISHDPAAFPRLWNKDGGCHASTVALYYVDYVNDVETVVVNERVVNEQFSADGKSIYFRKHDDTERVLYKTKDLSENSPYEAVSKIPVEYGDILLVRGASSSALTPSDPTPDTPTVDNPESEVKSCVEDESIDGSALWTTCYDVFPENACNSAGLGNIADSDYTQVYDVIDGRCLDEGSYEAGDFYHDKEYEGQTYQTYIIFDSDS